MAEEGAQPEQQPTAGDGEPSKEERIEFLKQAIAFTEWNIRSFDTKAQISIAAFVLSMNPLWTILSSANGRAGSSLLVAALLALFVATVLLFGYVIWPVSSTESNLGWPWPARKSSARS